LTISTVYVHAARFVNKYCPLALVIPVAIVVPQLFLSITGIPGKSCSPLSIIPLLLVSNHTVSQMLPAITCTDTSFETTGNDISGTLAENELV
jgi:hypothetical protein